MSRSRRSAGSTIGTSAWRRSGSSFGEAHRPGARAQETGGGYTEIRFGQDLAAAFAQVADELHGQYLLGFAPPKRDGKVHDISVRVAQQGLKARARRSYVAPKARP